MATKCFQSIQGLCIRVTRLDSCCNPPATGTPNSFVVSDSFITLGLKAELEAPDEFVVKLASGKLCINEIGVSTLKRYTVDLTLCNADPDLFEVMGGITKVLDYNGDTIGYEIDQDLGGGNKFSLEFWTRVPVDQCLPGVNKNYIYWLLPCLQNGRVGDLSIANGPLEFSFSADAIVSSVWGTGPYNVAPRSAVDVVGARLRAAIGQKTALHVQLTTIVPPCDLVGPVSGGAPDLDCGAKVMPSAPNTNP